MYLSSLLSYILKGLNKEEVFIEKSSSQALVLSTIRELLPKSKIINVIRDPRDVVASWLAASRTWADDGEKKSAAEFAKFWNDCISSAERFKSEHSNSSFIEIRYEDLLTDTEKGLSDVIKFLGYPVKKKESKR